MEKEIWKDVKGFEGKYQVSNYGNVKSLNWKRANCEKLLYLKKHNKGYRQVELVMNGKPRMYLVHRLVAQAFIPNPNNKPFINHIDANKENNHLENLEWCTQSENVRHSMLLNDNQGNSKRVFRREHILQTSKDGQVIKIWDKCIDIKTELGYNQTSIFECCEGKRKTAYGYKWQYAI